MKRILIPINFSELSANSLRYAHDLSKHLGMKLTLVHIYPEEDFNLKYDFGEADYDAGIIEKLKSFYEKNCSKELGDVQFLALEGAVNDEIIAISHNFELIVLTGRVTGNAFERFWGKRSSIIASEAKCPVLMIPEGVVYSNWEKIWHILRNSNEPSILRPFFYRFKIDSQQIQIKSFSQKTYTSSFWKMMVNFWSKVELDKSFDEQIKVAKSKEKIDIIILVSHQKDTFRKFLNDAAKHSFFKFGIPVLIFQEKKN